MVSKVLAGFFIVGITGALAYGAWNRTTAKLESSERASVRQQGAGYASDPYLESADVEEVPVRRSNGGGQGGGKGRQGDNPAEQGQVEASDQMQDWEIVVGRVSGISDSGLTVTLEDGNEILVEGRSWTFMQDSGFAIQVGDRVELTGFDEGGEFKLAQIENLTQDIMLSIREPSGRPRWAGGGRQNS